jgi:hypothetical protein
MLYAMIILSIVFWPLLAAAWAAYTALDFIRDVRTVHEWTKFFSELERVLEQNQKR